jgi:hypothetical protein
MRCERSGGRRSAPPTADVPRADAQVRTDTPDRTLRVAVIVGGPSAPRWMAQLLDRIDACPFADIVGLVRSARASPRARASVLYRAYHRFDAHHFAVADDPLDEIDIAGRLAHTPTLDVTVDAVEELNSWDLDVILSLGVDDIPRVILDCARHGVWSYHHGDPDAYAGGPPLFWEVYDDAPVSGSVLRRVTPGSDAIETIYRSFSATDPLSLHRGRALVYSKTAEFALRKLRDLHRDGDLGHSQQRSTAGRGAEPRGTPTNGTMLRFGCRVGARLARQKLRKAVARQQWFIAYRRRGDTLPSGETFDGATVLVPPRDRFYADPCVVDRRGSSYLFFEEFDFARQKGVVSCTRLAANGDRTPPQVVLERPYHLSYPFVFFVGEDAFMLPETAANGAIELYRAVSFPDEWELDAVLVRDVRAVDPTLIEHEGRLWLFANIAVRGASINDELFLFSAPSVRGPWQPHPRNPVVSDVRRARPAGRPFRDESRALIRPSQDCSSLYGSAVVFNRIEELSDTGYRETPIGRLEPGWRHANLGTHTYTASETWEAVDGRIWTRKAGRPLPPASALL